MPTTNPVLHGGEIFNSLNKVAHKPLGGEWGSFGGHCFPEGFSSSQGYSFYGMGKSQHAMV